MDLVKEFFASCGDYAPKLVKPFTGTTAKDTFSCKGNPVAGIQALIILVFWVGVARQVFNAIAKFDSPFRENFQFNYIVTFKGAAAIIVYFLQYVFWLFVGSVLSWFGAVKKGGCLWCWCCCFEGFYILGILGVLNVLAGVFYINDGLTAMGVFGNNPLLNMMYSKTWMYVLCAIGIINGLLSIYLGCFMVKVCQDPNREEEAEELESEEMTESGQSE